MKRYLFLIISTFALSGSAKPLINESVKDIWGGVFFPEFSLISDMPDISSLIAFPGIYEDQSREVRSGKKKTYYPTVEIVVNSYYNPFQQLYGLYKDNYYGMYLGNIHFSNISRESNFDNPSMANYTYTYKTVMGECAVLYTHSSILGFKGISILPFGFYNIYKYTSPTQPYRDVELKNKNFQPSITTLFGNNGNYIRLCYNYGYKKSDSLYWIPVWQNPWTEPRYEQRKHWIEENAHGIDIGYLKAGNGENAQSFFFNCGIKVTSVEPAGSSKQIAKPLFDTTDVFCEGFYGRKISYTSCTVYAGLKFLLLDDFLSSARYGTFLPNQKDLKFKNSNQLIKIFNPIFIQWKYNEKLTFFGNWSPFFQYRHLRYTQQGIPYHIDYKDTESNISFNEGGIGFTFSKNNQLTFSFIPSFSTELRLLAFELRTGF